MFISCFHATAFLSVVKIQTLNNNDHTDETKMNLIPQEVKLYDTQKKRKRKRKKKMISEAQHTN